jgi:hypothetical protein
LGTTINKISFTQNTENVMPLNKSLSSFIKSEDTKSIIETFEQIAKLHDSECYMTLVDNAVFVYNNYKTVLPIINEMAEYLEGLDDDLSVDDYNAICDVDITTFISNMYYWNTIKIEDNSYYAPECFKMLIELGFEIQLKIDNAQSLLVAV